MSNGGMQYVKDLRGRDLPEEDIKKIIQDEKQSLFTTLMEQDPKQRSDQDIEKYKSLEVATAYVALEDPKNAMAINVLKMAQEGKTATGQPTTGSVFALEKKAAPNADSRIKKENSFKLKN